MSAALEFRNLSHYFGHYFGRSNEVREVLRGVSLSIPVGERHALIGPNGAGKSTLFSIAGGALQPSAGRIVLEGSDITGLAPFQISRRGLARSQQVTSLFTNLSVRDNLRCAVLGARSDRYAFWRALESMADVRTRAEAMANAVGLGAQLDCNAGELPYAAQRALEIGVALSGDARVVLLDEPTAGMNQDESRAMVALIRRLTEGRTLLLVEHDMDVVFGLADRVSVLAGGVLIATGTPDEIRANAQVREVYPTTESAMLEVRDLHAGYGRGEVLQGVSLDVAPGECVALLGRNGVGRSTLLKAVMGTLPAPASVGGVRFNGVALLGKPTFDIARRGIGYVPEGREVFPNLSVAQNLLLGESPGKDRRAGRGAFDPYDIFPALRALRNTRAGVLSGGEQQMLSIARALAGQPSLLLVDEPTEGLAPALVQELARALDALRRQGLAILLVEQKMTIALALAQRICVMGRGRTVFEGTPAEFQAARSIRDQWLGIQGNPAPAGHESAAGLSG